MRVGLTSLVLFATAVAALYLHRPVGEPPSVPGNGRLQTPGMDLADESTRQALRWLRGKANRYRGRPLLEACMEGQADAPEIYVLSRWSMSSHGPVSAARVAVRIDHGGEASFEELSDSDWDVVARRSRRGFDNQEAMEFRELLVSGGYLDMRHVTEYRLCIGQITTLESCVNGRYFGVFQHCDSSDSPPLRPLAKSIEAFALGEQAAPAD